MDRLVTSSPDSVYMVEAYRAAGPAVARPSLGGLPDHPTVLAVIDIPGDEVALIVISARDAASAERVVRDTGMRPIRVVPVAWDAARVRDSPDVAARP